VKPLILFLSALAAGMVTHRITGSGFWTFVVILAIYLPALKEAHARRTMDRPSDVLLSNRPDGATRATMDDEKSPVEVVITRRLRW
jgi:hypothetical protein